MRTFVRAPVIAILCSALGAGTALAELGDEGARTARRQAKKPAASASATGELLAQGRAQPKRANDARRPAETPKVEPTVEVAPPEPPETTTASPSPPPSPREAAEPARERDGEARSEIDRELATVMDELVKARARAGVLAQALFRTSLEVAVMRVSDDARLERVVLTLDGAPIHDSDGSALSRNRERLFQGSVAPGMHELGVELTERAKENPAFGYVRRERFRIDVKNKRATRVELTLRDRSDMAEEVAEGDDGEYDVATKLRVVYGKARD